MFVIDVFEQAFRVVSRSAAVVGNRSEIRDYQIIEGPRCSSVQGNRGDCPGFFPVFVRFFVLVPAGLCYSPDVESSHRQCFRGSHLIQQGNSEVRFG